MVQNAAFSEMLHGIAAEPILEALVGGRPSHASQEATAVTTVALRFLHKRRRFGRLR